MDLLEALNGDLPSLARLADHILYHNKTARCQLVVAFFTGITGFEPDFDEDTPADLQRKDFLKAKFIREIEALFFKLFLPMDQPLQGSPQFG